MWWQAKIARDRALNETVKRQREEQAVAAQQQITSRRARVRR